MVDALHISPTSVSEWRSGKSKSYQRYLPEIADFLEVPISVFTGTKQMLTKEEINKAIQSVQRIVYAENLEYEITFNQKESSFLQNFRRLDDNGQDKVLSYMIDLIDTGKYTKNRIT